jgi:membrane protein
MPNVRYLNGREGGRPAANNNVSGNASAAEQHGRHAVTPWQIPWRGWKDILIRTYEQINEDRLLAVAAGVVFYGLLALFPAITAIVSCYALFAKASTINDHLSMLSGILPGGAFDIVKEQVGRVLEKGNLKLGTAFVVSFLFALWSANGGMKAIIDALNVVYDEQEKRGFFKLNAVSLAFTFGGLLAVLIAIGTVVALPIVLATIGLGSITEILFQVGRWPLLIVLMLLGLALLYRFGPSRRSPQWQWLSVGSVFATLTWLAGSALLSYYLANYANYDATYGSLGAAIGLMMWMWMSTIVVLFGAELNSEIEHQTKVDSTEGGGKPLGRRGAHVADTVGEAKA